MQIIQIALFKAMSEISAREAFVRMGERVTLYYSLLNQLEARPDLLACDPELAQTVTRLGQLTPPADRTLQPGRISGR